MGAVIDSRLARAVRNAECGVLALATEGQPPTVHFREGGEVQGRAAAFASQEAVERLGGGVLGGAAKPRFGGGRREYWARISASFARTASTVRSASGITREVPVRGSRSQTKPVSAVNPQYSAPPARTILRIL